MDFTITQVFLIRQRVERAHRYFLNVSKSLLQILCKLVSHAAWSRVA